MTINADIQMLKIYQFELRSKIKIAPFENRIKKIMLECLYQVHLPMHTYKQLANSVTFAEFRKKLASKVVSKLEAENTNPNLVKRVETYINKLTR